MAIVFVALCIGLVLPHGILSMKQDSLIPYVSFDTEGSSVVVIKNNRLALMEPERVRIWNCDTLSASNKGHSLIYSQGSSNNKYQGMDLVDSDHNSIQLLLHSRDHQSGINDGINIYDLEQGHLFCIDQIKKLRLDAVKFQNANTIITAYRNSIRIWNTKTSKSSSISLSDCFLSNHSYFISIPVVATYPTKDFFTCYVDATYINGLTGKIMGEKYCFTNQNNLFFILFILKQLLPPKEVVYEIVSNIQSFSTKQINTDSIKDTIFSMEYSPDGFTVVLTGLKNTYTCNLGSADITTMPVGGFSTFHPNSKILFVMEYAGNAIVGIDIKTKKVIYQHNLSDNNCINPVRGSQNNKLAFNKKGDRIAAAFNGYCQIYSVPESLQNFLNTYDSQVVPEIIIGSEKK